MVSLPLNEINIKKILYHIKYNILWLRYLKKKTIQRITYRFQADFKNSKQCLNAISHRNETYKNVDISNLHQRRKSWNIDSQVGRFCLECNVWRISVSRIVEYFKFIDRDLKHLHWIFSNCKSRFLFLI